MVVNFMSCAMATELNSNWTWVAKKPPTYCRVHGKRIRGFLNGDGMCDDCVDNFRNEYLGDWDATLEAVFSREEVAALYEKGAITRGMIEPLMRLAWEKPEKLRVPRLDEGWDFTLEEVHRLRSLL